MFPPEIEIEIEVGKSLSTLSILSTLELCILPILTSL